MVDQYVISLFVGICWLVFGALCILKILSRQPKARFSCRLAGLSTLVAASVVIPAPANAYVSVVKTDSIDPWDNNTTPSTTLSEVTSVQTDEPAESGEDRTIDPPVQGTAQVPGEKYVVRKGDNFWSIAKARTQTDQDLIVLWKKIIDNNYSILRSGNPNLIYPGEEIVIPKSDSS